MWDATALMFFLVADLFDTVLRKLAHITEDSK